MNWKKPLLVALALWFAAAARSEPKLQFQPWRCPENAGVNALYCYLRVKGIACNYADLLVEQSRGGAAQNSAVALESLAANNGFPLQARSLTMDELNACAKPVIVHVDGTTPEAGSFLLLVSTTEQAFYFVNGPSATFRTISHEDFRRVWSGVALLPVTHQNYDVAYCTIGLAAGMFLPRVVRFLRPKLFRQKGSL